MKAALVQAGSGGPESSCLDQHPTWLTLKCLQGIPGPWERNLKPLSGSKGLRNVGMWSIFVGSARGNPARLCLVTPANWRQGVRTKAALPTAHTFNTVTTVCPLPCYHTHSLVRVSNGFIYRKLGKVWFYTLPWGFQRAPMMVTVQKSQNDPKSYLVFHYNQDASSFQLSLVTVNLELQNTLSIPLKKVI